jgi:hypothetical protein
MEGLIRRPKKSVGYVVPRQGHRSIDLVPTNARIDSTARQNVCSAANGDHQRSSPQIADDGVHAVVLVAVVGKAEGVVDA